VPQERKQETEGHGRSKYRSGFVGEGEMGYAVGIRLIRSRSLLKRLKENQKLVRLGHGRRMEGGRFYRGIAMKGSSLKGASFERRIRGRPSGGIEGEYPLPQEMMSESQRASEQDERSV